MRFSSSSGWAFGGAEEPPAEQLRRMRALHGPPENEIPGVVAFGAVLARSDSAAVALVQVHAYSEGIELRVVGRLRPGHGQPPPRGGHLLGGGALGDPAGAVLLGVQLPDGHRISTPSRHGLLHLMQHESDAPTLMPGSGGGGDHSYESTYWLRPLPSPGDLRIVCAWPSQDLAETQTVIPGELVAEARARIVELWPWEPPPPAAPAPPPLDLPPGSWFEGLGGAGD